MKKYTKILFAAVAAVVLASCAEDVTTAGGGARQPVTFDAILSSDTRAPFNGYWDGGEAVGIQVKEDGGWGATRQYVVNNTPYSSTLVPAGGVEPYYLDEVQGKQLRAWYPYSDSYPNNTSMPEIQSDPEVYKNCDILEASDEILSANVPIVFKHSMARLSIKFKNVVAPDDVKVLWGDKTITPYHDLESGCYLAHLIGIRAGDVSVKVKHSNGRTYTYVVNQDLKGGKEYPIELTLGDYDVDADEVYHVYNANGLKAWAEKAEEAATDWQMGKKQTNISCTLEADITMPTPTGENESNWNALGSFYQDIIIYDGTFDGNGHTINNLKANGEGIQGLIGYLSGTVKNLTLRDVSIMVTSSDCAGAVAGVSMGGTIYGCQVIGGSVTCYDDNVGGIVGYAYSSKIHACSATCDVTGGNYIGGIAGNIEDMATITSCWTNCKITCSNNSKGAIVGYKDYAAVDKSYYKKNNDIGDNNATDISTTNWADAMSAMNAALNGITEENYDHKYIWAENTDETTKANVPLVLVKK